MTPRRILCLPAVSAFPAVVMLGGCRDMTSLSPETQTAVFQGLQSTPTRLVPSPTLLHMGVMQRRPCGDSS
jgi:hypothetical protein